MDKSAIGERMKRNYEEVAKTKLYRRTPVIVRVDGRSFHTFTRGFQRPFDDVLVKSMQDTMKYLCENVQGTKIGYVQSDEISLLLIDYDTFDTQAFFDNEVQKICSITASMATLAFNKSFMRQWSDFLVDIDPRDVSEKAELLRAYDKAVEKGAMFDSRCFNIPEEEVTNYFYWRQLDASRNSIQMVGQANFSHKELHGKSCNMIQDMLHEEKGINWNDFPIYLKRGSCCRKIIKPTDMGGRSEWIIDTEIPEFAGEGREYIEGLLP